MYINITSFYGSSCANNGSDALNTQGPAYACLLLLLFPGAHADSVAAPQPRHHDCGAVRHHHARGPELLARRACRPLRQVRSDWSAVKIYPGLVAVAASSP
eukprot:4761771-Pyramimonas_sp.AAC.1